VRSVSLLALCLVGSLDNSPSVTILDNILNQAVLVNASDVHLEPLACGLRVRYRRDGLLEDICSIMAREAQRILTRIKVLAKLDIAEKRIPQDGKFYFTTNRGEIDIRISTFPTYYGEKIVMRLLDQAQGIRSLADLGFLDDMFNAMTTAMQRPQGFFMVTGPTGSGKTTTLYALLSCLTSSERNVVTLEDPIEYTIPGTTQGHVRPDIGFDFATGIRAILRQDPDIILVGEMRDAETVRAALRAALTGHLVLSSLHTTDAVGAITRLLDMDVKSFLLSSVVTGVLAQRLVRKICNQCRTEVPSHEVRCFDENIVKRYHGEGCEACHGSGYRGRTAIFELLLFNACIRDALIRKCSRDELELIARQSGMKTLYDDAREKVMRGITSLEEVIRVLDVLPRIS
jgi:type II secretory ATPase GspE/PulE/Tfp pilus assembly ATPase PilB-like protein